MPPGLIFFIFLSLIAAAAPARAAAPPPLSDQKAWTEIEKKEFLRYLDSGARPAVRGSVADTGEAPSRSAARRARFVSLAVSGDTLFTAGAAGAAGRESTGPGGKLIVGGHLFSWIRAYTGAQFNRLRQEKLDGTRVRVDHLRVPAGLELALIPLGTPHTRYIILRGGVSAHHFESPAAKADFKTPLLGWQGSWDLGLGYEWQIPDTRWRLNLLAEGYSDLLRRPKARFHGLGLTAGLVFTF